jgi:hypothetical protein
MEQTSNRERRGLQLVPAADGPGEQITGEQVLRDGARVLSDYLSRRLQELRSTDPLYPTIRDQAARLARQAAPRSR